MPAWTAFPFLRPLCESLRLGAFASGLIFFTCTVSSAQESTLEIDTPVSPPEWALLQRELLEANADACEEFYGRYFDERGWLLCVERWGGNDGPDDAIENCNDWPLLHALGGRESILDLYKQAWEGHLRQYTLAKTQDVPFARDGMYYREFPVMFDWVHNGEGLTVFDLQGLSDPRDERFGQRVRRFAGFYTGEDPGATNYDPEYKLIRSLFNGSRGPLLRKATAVDWAGDPIEVEHRFLPGHGERNYEEMLAHFADYNDIVGDHPQNLLATTLALNAYMLGHEEKYRRWLLEYVDAWRERTIANGNIIPTNVGLDGTLGGEADGRWYGGVYGWAFSVVNPVSGQLEHRNTHRLGLAGFGNALLLTGDAGYIDVWRRQIDTINSQARQQDGRTEYPSMYGDEGWYAWSPHPYSNGALEVWYWSMDPADLERLPLGDEVPLGESFETLPHPEQGRLQQVDWVRYLAGRDPGFPVRALREDFGTIRRRVAGMRADPTTPDTRLSDDPFAFRPCTVRNLVHLMLGGMHPGHHGGPLHCRLRYFDPQARRAGLPPGVAALVDKLSADEAAVTLVNVDQLQAREFVVQGGAYGEHQFVSAALDGQQTPIDAPHFTVRLAPGAGARLVLAMRRYANQPTLAFPWDR